LQDLLIMNYGWCCWKRGGVSCLVNTRWLKEDNHILHWNISQEDLHRYSTLEIKRLNIYSLLKDYKNWLTYSSHLINTITWWLQGLRVKGKTKETLELYQGMLILFTMCILIRRMSLSNWGILGASLNSRASTRKALITLFGKIRLCVS
jgi:hypothetical protein